jgi:murein DD-endopeptidase MepM/ murein hydrolase activator NlpD
VATAQRLADVGATGAASGPHLHFEIWVGEWYGGGHAVDPLPYLRRWDAWS